MLLPANKSMGDAGAGSAPAVYVSGPPVLRVGRESRRGVSTAPGSSHGLLLCTSDRGYWLKVAAVHTARLAVGLDGGARTLLSSSTPAMQHIRRMFAFHMVPADLLCKSSGSAWEEQAKTLPAAHLSPPTRPRRALRLGLLLATHRACRCPDHPRGRRTSPRMATSTAASPWGHREARPAIAIPQPRRLITTNSGPPPARGPKRGMVFRGAGSLLAPPASSVTASRVGSWPAPTRTGP